MVVADQIVGELRLAQREGFGEENIRRGLWESVLVALIFIECSEKLLVIFLCVHMILHDVLKVAPRQVDETCIALMASSHELFEVAGDAVSLLNLVRKHSLDPLARDLRVVENRPADQ